MGMSQSRKLIKVWDFLLMILGFLYLVVFTLEVLGELSNSQLAILETTLTSIFVIFAVDVLYRLAASYKKLKTLKGWIDFLKLNWLGIVALFAPMLRSLAALRVLVVLRGLAPFLQSRVSKLSFYVGFALPLVIYIASLSVLEAEKHNSEANINTLSDAIWWSLVTVTTVGYGDRYPVTTEGRTVASFLIFVGIALFSTLTAVIASWVLADKVKSE